MHFMELHTGQDTTPETRYFVEAMHDRLGEVHPLIANSMQFVGQPEDPELNQLATERYKQYKNSRKT
jgi:thymidylate synthase ThyX